MPSFDPEKVQRYELEWCGRPYMQYQDLVKNEYGDWVKYDDFSQLKALLHDVSSEADPAGTLRELRQAQETVKSQETLIQQLRQEIERLRNGNM